jgi:lipopolysaccharide export system protein LptA
MSRRSFRNSLLLFAALCISAAAPALAFTLEKGKREPIVVTSNRMEADQLGELVTFSGAVTLKKEDVTMHADTVRVYYDPKNKGVREIRARGKVKVLQEGRVALADKAVYFSNEEKIVLTGDARVIENENQVGGERITLFIRENRSFVEGGNILFYQDGKPDDRKPRPLRRPGK